jgi:pimeloyl-ACP methyl ester carboxylesterase
MVSTRVARLHAYDAPGDGSLPTTVIIHGIGSTASSFSKVLARVQPHVRRVIAPELPGHGFSESPSARLTPTALFDSLCTGLDQLVTEPVILVGNSLGGALALRYAIERPARVCGLLLISPAGARSSPEELSGLVSTYKIHSTAEARKLLGRLYHRTPWYIPLLASEFHAVMNRPATCDFLDSVSIGDLPSPQDLGLLEMPVLLLWGRSERVLPPSNLRYFREHLPRGTVIEEPVGFGHCPHFDDPSRLAARIVAFARESAQSAKRA